MTATQLASRAKSRVYKAHLWLRGRLLVARHHPMAGGPPPGPGSGATAVINLCEQSLERYAYLFVRLFHDAGYAVQFRARPVVLESSLAYGNRYSELVLSIPGLSLDADRHVDASRAFYVTDAAPTDVPDRPWRAVVKVNYDWYNAPDDALMAPYPMHPFQYKDEEGLQHRAAALRTAERTIGLLFSGNADPARYSAGPLVDALHLLPRASIVRRLKESVPRERFVSLSPPMRAGAVVKKGSYDAFARAASHVDGGAADKMVVLTGWRIRDEDWATALAHSSFFVALPGARIPHSHSIVESMAVGTVPITNYGHLMRPPLTEAEALLFSTGDELEACLKRALAMPEQERRAKSRAAAAYYDAHLSSGSFGCRLEDAVERSAGQPIRLFVNAEHATLRAYRSDST